MIVKTIKAMIRKSRMAPKCPYNSLSSPIAMKASRHPPEGMKTDMIGIRISYTRAETSFPAAPPMITARARPTALRFSRKALNSLGNPRASEPEVSALATSQS